MQWNETGMILNAREYGEKSHLVTIVTLQHGRWLGLYKTSAKTKALIQPGNLVHAKWSARLAQHLGSWQIEMMDALAARILFDRLKLTALGAALSLADQLMAERHPYPHIYEKLLTLIHQIVQTNQWFLTYMEYELELLNELGFGLDLERCAVTGQKTNLMYLSPKTGRAVCEEVAQPYLKHLFKIPPFWLQGGEVPLDQFYQALLITGYFLQKDLLEKGLPVSRLQLQRLVKQQSENDIRDKGC